MSNFSGFFSLGRAVACGRRAWCWLGLVLLLAGAAPGNAAEQWRYVRTENFELLSQASEKKTRKLVAELEQFRASFIASFRLQPAHEPRVSVVLFDSDKRFTPFKPLYQGKPKEVAGLFIGGEDETVIALNLDVPLDEDSSAAETIFHEYVHLLLHTRGMKLPTWLNEGLAEVFSTFRVDGNTVVYGRAKQIYVDLLGVSPLMPIGQMMAVTERSPEYNEEERAGMFYAQAWALTHFLVCGEDRTNAAKLAKFLAAMDKDPSNPEGTFTEIFGFNFAELEQLLRTYLQGGRYFIRKSPVQLMDFADRVEFRTASDEERDLALINLHWRIHHSADARQVVSQIADRDPNSPRPLELLGVMAATDRDVRGALTRWRRAAELGSTSAYVLVQAARTKLLELGGVLDPDQRLRAVDIVELREWLDRAVRLSPHYGDAWEILALVEARASDVRNEVVNEVQRRVNGMKEPSLTLLALAVIRWRAGDLDTANEILKAVTDSPKQRREARSVAQALQRRFARDGRGGPRPSPTVPRPADVGSEPGGERFSRGLSEAPVAPSPAAVKPSGLEDSITRPPPPAPPKVQPIRLPSEAAVLGENGATLPPLDREVAAEVATAVGRGGDAPPAVYFRALAFYPEKHLAAAVSGEATVRFVINEIGRPENVRAWKSSAPEFGAAAQESLKQWRFIPAIKDGKAVSTPVELTLTFRL